MPSYDKEPAEGQHGNWEAEYLKAIKESVAGTEPGGSNNNTGGFAQDSEALLVTNSVIKTLSDAPKFFSDYFNNPELHSVKIQILAPTAANKAEACVFLVDKNATDAAINNNDGFVGGHLDYIVLGAWESKYLKIKATDASIKLIITYFTKTQA